jgi:hypothetical protein
MGGFITPADSGTLTDFVEIGQARDKILSLKLDQAGPFSRCRRLVFMCLHFVLRRYPVQLPHRALPRLSIPKAI